MFAVMRVALAVHRGLQADSAYRSGTPLDGWDLTTRDLLDLATSAGARLIGREHEIGSIRPGHFADLVLLRAQDVNLAPMDDAVASLVLHAHPGNVDTVLVAGRVVKRDGRLVGAPLDEARRLVRESRDRLRRASGTSADVVADEIWRF